MFWGLELKGNQSEKVTPAQNLHISNAAISASVKEDGKKVAVVVNVGDQKHTLCTLVSGKTDQVSLDIILSSDVEVSFSAQGNAGVSLMGYYVPESIAMDDDMSDEEGSESDEEARGIMRPPAGAKGKPMAGGMSAKELSKMLAAGDSEEDDDDDEGDAMDGSEGDDEDDEDEDDEGPPAKGMKPGDKRPQEAKKAAAQPQQPEKKQKVEAPQQKPADKGQGKPQQKPQTPGGQQKGQQKPQTPGGQPQQKPQTPNQKGQQPQKPQTPAGAGQGSKPNTPPSGQKPGAPQSGQKPGQQGGKGGQPGKGPQQFQKKK